MMHLLFKTTICAVVPLSGRPQLSPAGGEPCEMASIPFRIVPTLINAFRENTQIKARPGQERRICQRPHPSLPILSYSRGVDPI